MDKYVLTMPKCRNLKATFSLLKTWLKCKVLTLHASGLLTQVTRMKMLISWQIFATVQFWDSTHSKNGWTKCSKPIWGMKHICRMKYLLTKSKNIWRKVTNYTMGWSSNLFWKKLNSNWWTCKQNGSSWRSPLNPIYWYSKSSQCSWQSHR